MLPYLNSNLSCYFRDFMEKPISVQIGDQLISIKRCEMDILKAEEQIAMILRDIEEDKCAYNRMIERNSLSDDGKELHNYQIARRYLDVEKYQLDVRHHKRRLEVLKERLDYLYKTPTKVNQSNSD